IVLAKNSYTVESDGGSLQIEVGHNIDFDIEIFADWITKAENTRAFATENLIFNIAPNAAKQDRTGTIKIHSLNNTISHTITIFQKRYSSFDPSIGDWGDGGENGGTAE
ncbi:MAG: BACON domain-containing protein, partial [Alistipes sp.]|nr:BACON domain-containing protein [Alistipes sp.]